MSAHEELNTTEPPEDEPTAETEEMSDPETELAQRTEELAAAKEQLLRAHAELENFRKRMYRQMEEERRYASVPLMRDLLPVVDNLQRAIEAAQQNDNPAGLLDGVTMVSQQLAAVIRQHHCRPIDAKGQAFDPHLHEAIAQQPSGEVPEGKVIEVAQVGYLLHDRVLRPSQVLVSTGPDAEVDDQADDAATATEPA